jgi:hypothetical protein
MGRFGEIGFIEPWIPLDCRTHRVLLSDRPRNCSSTGRPPRGSSTNKKAAIGKWRAFE